MVAHGKTQVCEWEFRVLTVEQSGYLMSHRTRWETSRGRYDEHNFQDSTKRKITEIKHGLSPKSVFL
jgi:hypothetical protein